MTSPHKVPPLAMTLRGYAQSAPSLMRTDMAAAADAVEECARLRSERDEAREQRVILVAQVGQLREISLRVERERDAALVALRYAEAALADIGDADREPGDDMAWCESRAAEALPRIRAAMKDAK